MQNVLRSNSCKVCWFGFRKVEVLVVVLSIICRVIWPNRRRVNEEDYCGYTKQGMTMKSVSVVSRALILRQ